MTTKEAKSVNDREFDRAYREMLASFKELAEPENYRRIEFYFDYDEEAEGYDKPWQRPKAMHVNWAAIGSVLAADAMRFADDLKTAAQLAAGFEYNGCKIRYED